MTEIDYILVSHDRTVPAPFPYGQIDVINRDSGEDYSFVIEANALEGWLVRYVTDGEGQMMLNAAKDGAERERIEAPIRIVLRD